MIGADLLPEGAIATAGPIGIAAFAVLALAAVASGVAVVTRKSPVSAVAWLVVHFVATACLYVLMHSQFLGAVQVLVYAGAIMVLFLFVIMLLSADRDAEPSPASGSGRKALVACLLLVLVTVLARVAASLTGLKATAVAAGATPDEGRAFAEDSIEWLANDLFTRHLVAFEAASVVLLIAMAGAMVYTTRREAVGKADP